MSNYDVAVTGLGLTGLAMAVSVAEAGFRVIGLDDSPERVTEILDAVPGCGRTTTSEQALRAVLDSGKLRVRHSVADHSPARIHVLCVPTPSGPTGDADLTYLLAAVDRVAALLRTDDMVLVQSTCPPGTIDQHVAPRLRERSGLVPGPDVRLAHSPVRLCPGRDDTSPIPRVVAGLSPRCATAAVEFLRRIGDDVVPVSTVATAELAKVFENSFRLVNISLVNELAALCRASGIDVHEVLDAAATKPFGFLAHHPGAGAGGDCVPVSAGFLAAAARSSGVRASIVDAAIEVNDGMPRNVLDRVEALLAKRCRPPLRAGRVLVVGVTYKPDVPNVRRAAGVAVIERLRAGGDVGYADPYVPSLRLSDGTVLHAEAPDPRQADVALVMTRHRVLDLAALTDGPALVIDCATGWPRLVGADLPSGRHAGGRDVH